MDPNETLKTIRALIAAWDTRTLTSLETDQALEAISVLDTWMSKGGFPPEDWKK